MKNIVIVSTHMKMGGIQIALIEMIKSLLKQGYNITLLLEEKEGELLSFIPHNVNVIEITGLSSWKGDNKLILHNYFENSHFLSGFVYFCSMAVKKMTKSVYLYNRLRLLILKTNKNYFDIAIHYGTPTSIGNYYTMYKIKAKKKINWVHGDLFFSPRDIPSYQKIFSRYDKIFCVSQYVQQKFNLFFPSISDKVSVCYNLIDQKKIKINSQEKIDDRFLKEYIVSVGRLGFEKGFDIAIQAQKILINKGYKIPWYVIGYGPEFMSLKSLISKYKLEDYFILLGEKNNPYPYISKSLIYIQPSRHEGYCLSLAEARILEKPIITTNFPAASEQIKDNVTGKIVECNAEAIASNLSELLNSSDLREFYSRNLKSDNKISNVDWDTIFGI